MKSNDMYQKILEAAQDLVIEVGANHMTLDAVARRAELSKGGVLYHFPSKNALLRAMVERLIDEFHQARKNAHEHSPELTALQSCIQAFMAMPSHDERLMAALLAAAAHDPQLLEPAALSNRRLFMELNESSSIGSEQTAIVLAAIQGFILLKLLGVPFWTPEQYKGNIQELMKTAGGYRTAATDKVRSVQA